MTDTTHNESPYFDLVTSGIGYLNRARTVKPQQGSPYACVSIAALRGRSDSPQYSYFDCRIVGEEAGFFVQAYKAAINDHDTKVLVRFNLGDGEASSYELTGGANAGQRRHCIKARLLKITWAKLDDDVLDLGQDESSTDGPENASGSRSDAPSGVSSHDPDAAVSTKPAETAPASAPWEASLGQEVTLAKSDPLFAVRRAYLNQAGYQCVSWDDQSLYWRLEAA